ncbi:MAG: AbrB/MazE/SpoVT family DNA-binding domain-containing protein [Candidatus Edwardsbacteria bacterium]
MSSEIMITKVSSKGQITIPLKIRETLHIKDRGDIVGFQVTKQGVLLKHLELTVPEEDFTQEEWAKLERLAKRKGKPHTSAKKFLKELERL